MTRLRTLLLVSLAALACTGAALAAYPGTYGQQGGNGVLSLDGRTRFFATPDGSRTTLEALRGGRTRSRTVAGVLGIPTMIMNGTALGMFHDGSAFVLQSLANRSHTSFALVRTSDLRVRQRIALRGSYAFDAVSPNGRRLYLIEHRSEDFQHYVVRAYDLRAHRLLPGRIADKTQASWVMQGWPATRVETSSGRWVYTLYSNPGGFPFVHALDTVRGVAHCIGLPWRGSANGVYNMRLTLHGDRLRVHFASGRRWLSVDTSTWRVTGDGGGSFPWWVLAVAAALGLASIGARYHRLRDGRREGAFTPRAA
jgi:hypothetical protein